MPRSGSALNTEQSPPLTMQRLGNIAHGVPRNSNFEIADQYGV